MIAMCLYTYRNHSTDHYQISTVVKVNQTNQNILLEHDFRRYAWHLRYAVFGVHGCQYENELKKFINVPSFYTSDNCWRFGNDLRYSIVDQPVPLILIVLNCTNRPISHHRPASLCELLDECDAVFEIGEFLLLQWLVGHLCLGETLVGLAESAQCLVIVLVLIHLHLQQAFVMSSCLTWPKGSAI